MENIELVIKIPEELYEANNRGLEAGELWDLRMAVKAGTPLPKGHGRLVDMDEAIKCIEEVNGEDAVWAISLINWACSKRVVLEADKAESKEEG